MNQNTLTPAAPADYTHLLGTMVDALQDSGRAYVSGMLIKTKLGGMHMLRRSDGTMFLTPADLQPATGEEKKRVITYHFKGQRRFPITTTEIAEILGRGFNEVKINGERITATSTVAEIAAAQGELYAAPPRRRSQHHPRTRSGSRSNNPRDHGRSFRRRWRSLIMRKHI